MKSKELTQELVKELFDYNPDTGILTNKIARGGGTIAGSISGSLNNKGYLCVGINSSRYQVHRICYLHYYGFLPAMVDHIDTIKLNNKILNLRKCTSQQNNCNMQIRKDNKSGIKGVCWDKRCKKWRTQVRVNGKVKSLGRFTDIEEAKKAVEAERVKHHKEFANHG